jgi:hypothetical protein
MDNRRRSERTPTSIPARLHLAHGRDADVTISNVGELGALVTLYDLEVEVREGERALLEHPPLLDGHAGKGVVRTPAAVVRVDLDLTTDASGPASGVVRHVALYFDGGPKPVNVH